MSTLHKTALATTFVATSALGCGFVFLFWSDAGATRIGVSRAFAFIAIMAAIHAIGYLLYERQAPDAATSRTDPSIHSAAARFSGSYRRALTAAALQQLVFLGLTSLLLDGGHSFRACCITAIVHWICIAMILLRRSDYPTRFDLGVIKYGFVPLALLVGRVAPVVHRMIDN